MSDTNDGGPAFPLGDTYVQLPGEAIGRSRGHPGMTLRDWFAGQALCGSIAFPIPGNEKIPENAARFAYAYADAMLAARKAKP